MGEVSKLHKIGRWLRSSRRKIALSILGLAIVSPLIVMAAGYQAIQPNAKYILANIEDLEARQQIIREKRIPVGLVLGAGVDSQGRPYRELRARLDVAAVALQRGDVQKLILSGDNRFSYYDEPTAMKDYLTDTYGISEDKLQRDFAGRSTYESCQRASQVFGQDRLILFSAQSHLPRAIYLCRNFGIETYGIASRVEANNADRREAVARVKALYNVHIKGEPTILGAPIGL